MNQFEAIAAGLDAFSQDEQKTIGELCSQPREKATRALYKWIAELHAAPYANGRSLDAFFAQANLLRELADSIDDGKTSLEVKLLKEKIASHPEADQDEILEIYNLPKAEAIAAYTMRIEKLKADPYGNGRTVRQYREQIDLMRKLIETLKGK